MSKLEARYYPILRGRQNELIAVRELASEGKLANVIPVIEPVKASSTLIKTLSESFHSGATIGIVLNPQVGSFDHDLRSDPDFCKRYAQLLNTHDSRVRFFIRISTDTERTIESALSLFADSSAQVRNWNAIMTRDTTREAASTVQELQEHGEVQQVIATFPKPINRFRENRVLLTAGIDIRARNADYRNPNDEFFSDGPSSYSLYGCDGFSDYSIVGETYKSGGFSPRAVALHITYFDEDNDVRVRHFVSNPPDDTGDVPGKYADAVESLCSWAHEQKSETLPRTIGLDYYDQTLRDQRFPGLGAAKKYSIMHHLEMIDWYLESTK